MTVKHNADSLKVKSSFSSYFYNSMPAVEDANENIHKYGVLTRAIEVLGPIFHAHNTDQYCGINLLHKHWAIKSDELPEQIPLRENSENILVTRPILCEEARLSFPASWALPPGDTSSRMVPLEFTTGPLVRDCLRDLMRKPAFIGEVKCALTAHELAPHFGLCIALRRALPPDPNADLVETTEPGRSSTLRARTMSVEERKNSIQTVWLFSGGSDPVCATACFKPCQCMNVIKFPDGQWTHDSVPGAHEKQHEIGPA